MSRLEHLESLLKNEPGDPFLRYGIAMEHKKAGRLDLALEWFTKTLAAEATYCYAWYQQGQIHEMRGDHTAARAVYEQGILVAKQCNDEHAAAEMRAALDALEE